MKLYDVEASAQEGLADNGHMKDDKPVFDKSAFGSRMQKTGDFSGFKF